MSSPKRRRTEEGASTSSTTQTVIYVIESTSQGNSFEAVYHRQEAVCTDIATAKHTLWLKFINCDFGWCFTSSGTEASERNRFRAAFRAGENVEIEADGGVTFEIEQGGCRLRGVDQEGGRCELWIQEHIAEPVWNGVKDKTEEDEIEEGENDGEGGDRVGGKNIWHVGNLAYEHYG
jgi:hypothetical protein